MDEKKTVFPSMKDVPETSWKKLAGKRIYFGHQSVGFNIMEGINETRKENPQIKIKVIETNNPRDLRGPFIAHSRVGENAGPASQNVLP